MAGQVSQRGQVPLLQATASRSGPSGSAKPHSPAPPCRRQSSASRDHDATVRRRSHLRIQPDDRILTAAQTGQRMATILARARISEHLTRHRCQPERVVKFAIGEQSSIGGDQRSRETAASGGGQNRAGGRPIPIHPPGSPSPPPAIQDKLADRYIRIAAAVAEIGASSGECRFRTLSQRHLVERKGL